MAGRAPIAWYSDWGGGKMEIRLNGRESDQY
jgi:hypothetical protein